MNLPNFDPIIYKKVVSNSRIVGFSGDGFVEIDRNTKPEGVEVKVPVDGVWTLAYRYANGNGPVNTENKAALRTLLVDGQKVGTVVLPQRGVGNWDDWGITNILPVTLKAGTHTVTIEYLPEDENMNIQTNHALLDRLILELRNEIPDPLAR